MTGHRQAGDVGWWTLEDAAGALGATIRFPDGHPAGDAAGTQVRGAGNDARTIHRDAIFVALPGTGRHGAGFAQQAHERGAAAMLVGTDAPRDLVDAAAAALPVLEAPDDALAALGRLAHAWRRRCDFTVVAITGSSGKTSTKDMLAALLARHLAVTWSHANHNNEIGLPLTLLSAPPHTDVVICEMGMRGLGQIDYLCGIAEPDVGIVTNAGSAHLELLGTIENIVSAKAELIAGVRDGGVAVVPAAQPELPAAARRRPPRVVTFGDATTPGATCVADGVERVAHGIAGELVVRRHRIPFELPVHGAHNALNLAACACAYEAVTGSLDGLAEGCAHVQPGGGRGRRHRLAGGGVLIDDAYNANPESMRAAIAELAHLDDHRRVAVLGGMAELGEAAAGFHDSLGEHVAAQQVDELVVVATSEEALGLARAYERASGRPVAGLYASADEALRDVSAWLREGDAVLVKASNGVGLGRLVDALVERFADRTAPASATAGVPAPPTATTAGEHHQ